MSGKWTAVEPRSRCFVVFSQLVIRQSRAFVSMWCCEWRLLQSELRKDDDDDDGVRSGIEDKDRHLLVSQVSLDYFFKKE